MKTTRSKKKLDRKLMKKNLKGEAFLSSVIFLNSYPEPTQRSLSRFMEQIERKISKKRKGNKLSRIILFQSLSFKTGI